METVISKNRIIRVLGFTGLAYLTTKFLNITAYYNVELYFWYNKYIDTDYSCLPLFTCSCKNGFALLLCISESTVIGHYENSPMQYTENF